MSILKISKGYLKVLFRRITESINVYPRDKKRFRMNTTGGHLNKLLINNRQISVYLLNID